MKYILGIGGLALVCGVAWWLLSPLFINVTVNDSLSPELAGTTAHSSTTSQPVNVRGPFPINGTQSHPATGSVRVIKTSATTTIRFEAYNGTNGPDLFVYLAKDLDANEFVNLGRARGNVGNINYVVPADIDISEYRYVMTWCRAFRELFDYADITPR